MKKEIVDEKAGILPPPLVPKMPLVVTLGKKRKPAAKGKGVLPPYAAYTQATNATPYFGTQT